LRETEWEEKKEVQQISSFERKRVFGNRSSDIRNLQRQTFLEERETDGGELDQESYWKTTLHVGAGI